MKRYQVYALAFVMLAGGSLIARNGGSGKRIAPAIASARHFHVALTPETIQWKPFYPGAEVAVLSGDPSKVGSPYVLRIKHRDGLRVPPHWHPFDGQLTVITGTWVMGMGEKFDLATAQEFPAGSYLVSPKDVPHYALSKGETIVQVHGTGPFVAYFINPEDDVFRNIK